MYCTQPAARRFGPADQAEPTASGPVVGSPTLVSAQTRVACHEGQYGFRSGPAPAPLFRTSARQPSSARHAGGEQRVTGIDQVGQLGRPEPQFWSKSANPRLKPAWLSSTPARPAASERDDGRTIAAGKQGASRLLGVGPPIRVQIPPPSASAAAHVGLPRTQRKGPFGGKPPLGRPLELVQRVVWRTTNCWARCWSR